MNDETPISVSGKPGAPEADLAFLRSIVDAGSRARAPLSLGVAYLAGGLLYGLQCLFHFGQMQGWIRWPGLANLSFVIGITVAFLVALAWAIREDRRSAGPGPLAGRALKAAFNVTGIANLAMIIVFGVGAMRDHDMAVWLYYGSVVFVLQACAWSVAWQLKKQGWMLASSAGCWLAATALGVLVRQPAAYLAVCTAALLLLFAAPGWVMTREAWHDRSDR